MVRGPVSKAIALVAMLVITALVMGGPRVFESVLPEGAVAWLEDMGTGSTMGAITLNGGNGAHKGANAEDPLSHLRDAHDGWRPSSEIAALPGNGAAFIADVVKGRRSSVKGHSPAVVQTLAPMQGCAFTPPSDAAFVGHVSALWKSGQTLDLATYGDADLADAVAQLARAYRKTGSKRFSSGEGPLRALSFDAYDVVVTETARPVYLVLQSTDDHRLWNIHLAPGAHLERVVLLGGAQVGVANLPDTTPVEALRTAEADACAIPRPFYALNPGAMIYRSLERGTLDPAEGQATLDKIAEQGRTYDVWFRSQFGVSADETMAGNWIEGAIAVAGPVPATPEARPEWRPIKGAGVQITQDSYIEYEGLTAQGTGFVARVEAIARAFAWGDLANLETGVEF